MTSTDWEIYITDQAGAHTPVTRDIQHDIAAAVPDQPTLVGMMGEPRHRRSQLYDVDDRHAHAPVLEQHGAHDQPRVHLGAERRRPARRSSRPIATATPSRPSAASTSWTSRARSRSPTCSRGIDRQLAEENDLRQRMTQGVSSRVEAQSTGCSPRRQSTASIEYEKALFDFDSKYITQPGNAKAIEYLEKTYRSFGYDAGDAVVQPASSAARRQDRQRRRRRCAAPRIPSSIYVVSSHFDSVAVGPGADDDTSGTAALLEAARDPRRQPAAGDRRLRVVHRRRSGPARQPRVRAPGHRQTKWNVVGALNNDMIGWGGEGAADGQHDPLLERRHQDIQHGARVPVHEARHLRRQVLPRHRRQRVLRRAGATSSAASGRIRCWRIRTITSRPISSRR